MNSKYLLPLLLSLALLACIPKEPPPPLVEKAPFKLLVHFSSELPDPYYVTSGPFQSYQRFAVNDSFQRRLRAYAAAKSDPLASQALELSVHLISLQTSYDRLGSLPGSKGFSGVLMAGAGWRGGGPVADLDSFDRDPFDDLPEQITKTATLSAAVGISWPGQAEIRDTVVGRSVEVLERWDMGLGMYDYAPLIAEAQIATLREIDQLLHLALAREGPGDPHP